MGVKPWVEVGFDCCQIDAVVFKAWVVAHHQKAKRGKQQCGHQFTGQALQVQTGISNSSDHGISISMADGLAATTQKSVSSYMSQTAVFQSPFRMVEHAVYSVEFILHAVLR